MIGTATHRVTAKGLPQEHTGTQYNPGALVDVTAWHPSTIHAWVFEGRLVPLARTEDEIAKAAELRVKQDRKDAAAAVATITPVLAELNQKADALSAQLGEIETYKRREAAVRAEFDATIIRRNTEQVRLDAARERLAELGTR